MLFDTLYVKLIESAISHHGISKDDLELVARKVSNDSDKQSVQMFIDGYDSPDVQSYLHTVARTIKKTLELLNNKITVPHHEEIPLLRQFICRTEYGENLWPVVVYVSAGDEATVGVSVSENGRVELFEGNEDASIETTDLVNRLLASEEYVTVYTYQPNDVVLKIKDTGTVPKGIYVSPNREHARKYWGFDREFTSFNIATADVNQESDIDWKITRDTSVKRRGNLREKEREPS